MDSAPRKENLGLRPQVSLDLTSCQNLFNERVDALITFVDGKGGEVDALVHKQRGQERRAEQLQRNRSTQSGGIADSRSRIGPRFAGPKQVAQLVFPCTNQRESDPRTRRTVAVRAAKLRLTKSLAKLTHMAAAITADLASVATRMSIWPLPSCGRVHQPRGARLRRKSLR